MPITINGSGTVTGISAGGLPDSCITTDDIAANAVTAAKLGADQASGLAKAFVNFNGTGTVAIRASFNVSSITDNGTGDYTVNFTTALADANYSFGGYCTVPASRALIFTDNPITYAAGSLRVSTGYVSGTGGETTKIDATQVNVSIFR
jgi:hypothetical protein